MHSERQPRSRESVLELLGRDADPAEHAAIRDLWKRHSIAEENRDLDGLLSTLTDDCVYELAGRRTCGAATRVRRASTSNCCPLSPTSTSG